MCEPWRRVFLLSVQSVCHLKSRISHSTAQDEAACAPFVAVLAVIGHWLDGGAAALRPWIVLPRQDLLGDRKRGRTLLPPIGRRYVFNNMVAFILKSQISNISNISNLPFRSTILQSAKMR